MSRFKNIWIVLILTLFIGSSAWGACGTHKGDINPLGSTHTGVVRNNDTNAHYYEFTTTTPMSLELSLSVAGANTKVTVTRDSSACSTNQIYSGEAKTARNGEIKNAMITLTEAGTYRIKLIGSTSSNSTYTLVASLDNSKRGYRPFTVRFQENVRGDMTVTGNTILVPPGTNQSATSNSNTCSTYTNGTYITDAREGNQAYYLCGYSVDNNPNVAATTAGLNLPEEYSDDEITIVWAGLYWQSIVDASTRPSPWTNMPVKIRLDGHGAGYKSVKVDSVDYERYSTTAYTSYSAFSDVTEIFKTNGWKKGKYTVSGIPVYEGIIAGLGTYGAWTLVIAYEVSDPDLENRNVTIFDGWQSVSQAITSVDVKASGFLTPNRANISSKLAVFTAEGDKHIPNDRFNTYDYTKTNPKSNPVALGALANNAFNSSISGIDIRTPKLTNNNGIDIHNYEIGQYLKPKQTEMEFRFTSTKDQYWPSMLAFSTELYVPDLCYDYSFKQDGVYIKNDDPREQALTLNGNINPNSDVEVSLYLRSLDGDFDLEGISLFTEGLENSQFSYVPNSVEVSQVNGSGMSSAGGEAVKDECNYEDDPAGGISCYDGTNIRFGLGRGATGYSQKSAGKMKINEFIYTKFKLKPNFSSITDISQKLNIKYDFYIKSEESEENRVPTQELGKLNMCPPSEGAYEPLWGMFNVVDREANDGVTPSEQPSYKLPYNNLKTQVTRRPFYTDLAVYGRDSAGEYKITPQGDVKTTVLVEMMDNESFHDITSSTCGNPDAAISEPIIVPVDAHETRYRIEIPPQDEQYFNRAVKNATFRIWFFEHNGTIADWEAYTHDGIPTIDKIKATGGISGLYNEDEHPLCANVCDTPAKETTKACFDCIKLQYAKPICARDNFSIRPESYDLRIYDTNQTDSSMIYTDLSSKYNYTPVSAGVNDRINIAAGYEYRYDMNSTGNDSLEPTPGYTRNFKQLSEGGYYARMKWDSAKTLSECNDVSHLPMSFYVANGMMIDTKGKHSQVGEYRLEIYDKDWTAVDWNTSVMTHHTKEKGFRMIAQAIEQDCVENSDHTDGEKIGCITQSEHTGGTVEPNGALAVYKNHKLRMKPARFATDYLDFGLGFSFAPIDSNGTSFIYKSDIGFDKDVNNNPMRDSQMSVRSDGKIEAYSYDGRVLTNFVGNCYAADLDFFAELGGDINSSNFKYRVWGDDNGTVIDTTDTQKQDLVSMQAMKLDKMSFIKDNKGTAYPKIHMNDDRVPTVATPPVRIEYYDMNITCSSGVDCAMEARDNSILIGTKDGNSTIKIDTPDTAIGLKALDFNVTHVYGRVATNKTRVFKNDTSTDIPAAFEVYLPDGGAFMGKNLAQNKFTANWYINQDHNITTHGDANVTHVMTGGNLPIDTKYEDNGNVGNIAYTFGPFVNHNTYRAHIKSGGWLWFGGSDALEYRDPVNPGASSIEQARHHPTFEIFHSTSIGSTGSAKTESESFKDNKKSTGRKSTREYAPAIK